jgi:hypothetical protein
LGGGPPTAITSYFSDLGGFGVLTDPGGDGIGDCGLSGGISNLTAAAGPLTSVTNLGLTPYSSYPANSFYGSASATANYGSLSIATSGTVNGVQGANGNAETVAFGIASDTLNVACLPACTTGYMAFEFGLTGSLTVTNPANGGGGEMQVNVQAGSNNENIFYSNVAGASVYQGGIENVGGTLYAGQPVPGCLTGSGNFVCTNATLQTFMMPVTFTGGVSFSFGLLGDTTPDSSQTVTVDPPDMSLSGIQVYDAGGNLISNFTITSGSGSAYGADGFESGPVSGTPEPGTLISLALGLVFLGLGHRRSRYKTV